MDIEDIHVGAKYNTASGHAIVTGIDRENDRVQLQSLDTEPPGLPLPGVAWVTTYELSADQVYEEIIS